MKTWEDINSLAWNADEKLYGKVAGQAIADAWNAEVEELNRQLGFYFSCTQKQTAKAISLRKQLRKLRNELAHARRLKDLYSHQVIAKESFEVTLTDMIIQIARGGE